MFILVSVRESALERSRFMLRDQGKIEVGIVKLDIFRNYWTVQFGEISSRVKSPNFGYRAYREHCVIGPVGVQLG